MNETQIYFYKFQRFKKNKQNLNINDATLFIKLDTSWFTNLRF